MPPTPPLYTTGGTVQAGGGIYLSRQADAELFTLCQSGGFAYILTSRQMGKSSLMVQTATRLSQAGIRSATVDLSVLGAQATAEQWYLGFLVIIEEQLELETNVERWWQARHHLGLTQRMIQFFKEVLLVEVTERVVIFVDEIDSTLSLDFTDDFFAAIRYFYVARSQEPAFHRLSFVLIGVASPSDLIRDKSRTPFNIGREIVLAGFQIDEVQLLMAGFVDRADDPQAVLSAVLSWTGGQPFLTQKLCQLIVDADSPIPVGHEAATIEQLVRSRILENWETQDQPEHLRTIRDRLLTGGEQRSGRRLGLCQQIVQQADVAADDSPEQTELRLTGLVVKRQGKLRIYNRIYEQVFNGDWLEQSLAHLRPYGGAIAAWLASDRQDDFQLLRGQELEKVRAWAQDKSLGDDDRRFLDASQAREMQTRVAAEQEANQILMVATQKANRRNLISLVVAAAALTVTGIAVPIAIKTMADVKQAKITLAETQQVTQIERTSTLALRQFDSQPVPALVTALNAGQQLQTLVNQKAQIKGAALINQKLALSEYPTYSPIYALNQILSTIQFREIPARQGVFLRTSWSPDGKILATSGDRGTVKLWKPTGESVKTLNTQQDYVLSMSWSPDGKTLATSGEGGTVKFWSSTGELVKTLNTQQGIVFSVSWSPDRKTVATGGSDGSVKLWPPTGDRVKTLKTQQGVVRSMSWSPDGKTLAIGGDNGSVKLWMPTGEPIQILNAHKDIVFGVGWSPDGKILATGSSDGSVKLWSPIGAPLKTLNAHKDGVRSVSWSPDGKTLATGGSDDGDVKLWSPTGNLLKTLNAQHKALSTFSVDWSSDGKAPDVSDYSGISISWSVNGNTLATSGDDGSVNLWNPIGEPAKTLKTQQGIVSSVSWSPDGKTLATGGFDGFDGTVKLWNRMGESLKTLNVDKSGDSSISWSPDGKTLATGGLDGTVKLWNRMGESLKTLNVDKSGDSSMSWNPDGKTLATGGSGGIAKLWTSKGEIVKILHTQQGIVSSMSWSPDGKTLATGGLDGTVKLWNRMGESVKILNTQQGHQQGQVLSMSWSPDGKTLATSDNDGSVKLWSHAGDLVKTLNTLRNFGSSLSWSWSGDGQTLATIDFGGTVKLWTSTGELLKTLNTQQSRTWSVSWSPDGSTLATGGSDGTVKLWPTEDLDALLAKGCLWTSSYLINASSVLQTLTTCQTPTLLRTAAPNLLADSEALARNGNIEAAIQGFKTAQQWNPRLTFDPVARAQALAKAAKSSSHP